MPITNKMPRERIEEPKHVWEVITGTYYVQTAAIAVDYNGDAWLDITVPLFKTKDDIACIKITRHNDGTWTADISETGYKWPVSAVNTDRHVKIEGFVY